jgi:hypothetical protein
VLGRPLHVRAELPGGRHVRYAQRLRRVLLGRVPGGSDLHERSLREQRVPRRLRLRPDVLGRSLRRALPERNLALRLRRVLLGLAGLRRRNLPEQLIAARFGSPHYD